MSAADCGAGVCFTCAIAGLQSCPFQAACGPNLPLCFGELPKVTKRPRVLYVPPGATFEEAERIVDKFYGKRP